jgi:cobyrinic acid a,c-diamide synthase
MTPAGLLISAPASGTGKTTVTLGIARALTRAGVRVQCFKAGPDYIDPAFHRAATGRDSFNLDAWAMGPALLDAIAAGAEGADLVIAEGAMGLFDGVARPGASGTGASADIAARMGWPVVLVIDPAGQAQTAGAVAAGLAGFRPDLRVAGVILNRVASDRHAALVRDGMARAGLPVLGVLPKDPAMAQAERHLGLVQAEETGDLPARLDAMADRVARGIDLDALSSLAAGRDLPATPLRMTPPGQRIALARDAAFSFVYPHLLAAWRGAGAEVLPFSPLADETPDPAADVCWLPGGYPELHAGRLAAAARFRAGLAAFADSRPVHGECGGYMVLGAGLVAADGTRHPMAGLLGLETSFAQRRMHLGYRRAQLPRATVLPGRDLRGHEFHYATITAQPDAPLAEVTDATGAMVPETGSFRVQAGGGLTSGSFFHLIAPC